MITLFAAAEISYIVYSWDGRSAPGCDSQAVQFKVLRLVQHAVERDLAGSVAVANIEEIDRRVTGGTTVKRNCAAEAAIDDGTTTVIYEIRPDGGTNDYRVVLSQL